MLVAGRAAAARLRRQLHLRAGADRLQGGHRRRHRRRPDAEAARHPLRRRRASSRTSLRDRPSTCRETSVADAGASALAMIVLLVGLERFAAAGCRRRWSRWRSASPPRRCSASRAAASRRSAHIPRGLPRVRAARPRPRRRALARRARHRADELHRDDRRRPRVRARSDEPPSEPNQELLATGLANVGGGFFGAMPAGGGTSQTAVNRLAGARTQLAALVTAAVALATLLLLAPADRPACRRRRWPRSSIVYSIGLIQPGSSARSCASGAWSSAGRSSPSRGVVLLGTLQGILVAIVVSLRRARAAGRRPAGLRARAQARHQRLPRRSPPSTRTTRPSRAC